MRGTYKNPTEDASPAPGGTGLPREGRKPVRDALGIGSDLAPVPPGAGEASPAPGGTGPPASPAPGGTGWRPSRGQLRRPVPPGAGDATLTGPTLRANLPPRRGGATIP